MMQMKKYKLNKGVFIAIEGIDGAGKTTQVQRLKEYFQRKNLIVNTFKEPTDGHYGQLIREIAKTGRHLYTPEEELNLFLMDRKEDCEKNINPALAKNELVIMDRYYHSNIAYQGALGIDRELIQSKNEKIAIIPDLVIILDCAVRVGLARIKYSRNETPNHFENEHYLQKVKKIFQAMSGPNIQVVNSTPDEDTVFNHVRNIVNDMIAPYLIETDEQQDLFGTTENTPTYKFSEN